jgi:hypothetical protein
MARKIHPIGFPVREAIKAPTPAKTRNPITAGTKK